MSGNETFQLFAEQKSEGVEYITYADYWNAH